MSKDARGVPVIIDHKSFESYIGRYCGLILYLKEMDESVYAKICAVSTDGMMMNLFRGAKNVKAYFSASSELHSQQVKALISICNGLMKSTVDDETEGKFFPVDVSTISYCFPRFQWCDA